MRHSRVSRLRSKHSPISDSEWEDILSALLSSRNADKNRPKTNSPEKLELSSVVVGDQLTLIIRRNISGITQRLGEILLQVLDEEEAGDRVELLDWVGVAVDRTTALEQDIQNLNAKYEEQGRTIEKLHQQLEDFIETKKEHEASLLEKFQALLNAKKLKIRDQQRLLAGAKMDPQKGKYRSCNGALRYLLLTGAYSPTNSSNSASKLTEAPSKLKSSKEKGGNGFTLITFKLQIMTGWLRAEVIVSYSGACLVGKDYFIMDFVIESYKSRFAWIAKHSLRLPCAYGKP